MLNLRKPQGESLEHMDSVKFGLMCSSTSTTLVPQRIGIPLLNLFSGPVSLDQFQLWQFLPIKSHRKRSDKRIIKVLGKDIGRLRYPRLHPVTEMIGTSSACLVSAPRSSINTSTTVECIKFHHRRRKH